MDIGLFILFGKEYATHIDKWDEINYSQVVGLFS